MDAAIAMFMKPLIDNTLVDRQAAFTALIPFLIVGFTLLQGVLKYSAGYVNAWVGNKITNGLKYKLYDKLLRMDGSYFDHTSSGMVLMRFSTDAEAAANGLVENLKNFLTKIFSSLGLVGVLVYNSWQLAIVGIIVIVFMVYPLKIVRKKIRTISHKSIGGAALAITLCNETFNGNKIIAAYNLEDHMEKRYKDYVEDFFHLKMGMVKHSNWLSPAMHFISSIGVALVIGFGSHLIVKGTITAGNFVAFLTALLMLYTPLKTIGKDYVNMLMAFLAVERIFDIFETEPVIKRNEDGQILTKIEQGIEFKDVRFEYLQDNEVLHGISFKVKAGEMLALVGNSGGGKTTISSLIPRLYEIKSGEILIDGVNIRDYTLKSLRGNIAVVFQDNFLFSGTIRENIMLGNHNASEDDVWEAVSNACLSEFVNSLEKKLDTIIGERGIMLSGGQKQRVAIARAFLKDAPVVILDEATSALDNKSEKVVQQALENLMFDRTVIVIAHRLSTVQHADKILVIQNGEILEAGTHAELIANGGAYSDLYSTQFIIKDPD